MLEQFIAMIRQADMLIGFEQEDDTVIYDGENVEVTVVKVPTSDTGDFVEAIFHKGTDTLIDMNAVHKCTCGGHCHH